MGHPAPDLDGSTPPGTASYLIALLAGVPVTVASGIVMLGNLLDGYPPGLLTLLCGGSAVTGIVLAVKDLRTGSRRRRIAALLLTVLPATLLGLELVFVLLVVAMLGGGNPNS